MAEQTITLTMLRADAEILLGVLSSERYTQRSKRSVRQSADNSTKSSATWRAISRLADG